MKKLIDNDEEAFKSSLSATVIVSILLFIAIVILYFFLFVSDLSLYEAKKIDNPVPPGDLRVSEGALFPVEPSPSQDEVFEERETKITIHQEDVITEIDKKEEIVYEERTEVILIGPVLDARAGTIQGPSGKETYYNLDMASVISSMRSKGYSEEEYPYWIRGDGVKMLGNYIIVAADFNTRPKGTILETSLGTGMVCDTGGFVKTNPTQIDIATNW